MKTIRNITGIVAILLIAVSIVGNTLDFAHNHAFLMLGVVLLLAIVLPLTIITNSYTKIRDGVIKQAEKANKRKRYHSQAS